MPEIPQGATFGYQSADNGYIAKAEDSLFPLNSRPPHNMPYAARAKTQQFNRRKPNLIKKADQLARLCHADEPDEWI